MRGGLDLGVARSESLQTRGVHVTWSLPFFFDRAALLLIFVQVYSNYFILAPTAIYPGWYE